MEKMLITYSDPKNIFLIVGLIFGVLFLLITPPFQAPDEVTHFYRAYQVSQGRFFAERKGDITGGDIPSSFPEAVSSFNQLPGHPYKKINYHLILEKMTLPLNSEKTFFASFPNTALYPPLSYFPQALGIILPRLLNLSPLFLMYCGRLFNLMAWIGVVYFAIKITPVMKWCFLILALTPMSLFLAASLSADAFTNGISFLVISYILRLAFDNNEIIKKDQLLKLALIVLFLSFAKPIYFLILFLFFIIPLKKFNNDKKRYILSFLFIFLFGIMAQGGWAFLARGLYVPARSGITPPQQLVFVLHHPLEFLQIFLHSFWRLGWNYIESFLGILGWLDTLLPKMLLFSLIVMLFVGILFDSKQQVLISMKQKMFILFPITVIIFLVSLSQFINWTESGAGIIKGIQGRYFIPIGPLVLLLFYNRSFRLFWKHPHGPALVFTPAIVVILAWTLNVMVKRYYV